MTFEMDSFEVNGDKLTISKEELEKKFQEYRKLGYENYNLYRESGDAVLLNRSSVCHAKADVFMDLLGLFEI